MPKVRLNCVACVIAALCAIEKQKHSPVMKSRLPTFSETSATVSPPSLLLWIITVMIIISSMITEIKHEKVIQVRLSVLPDNGSHKKTNVCRSKPASLSALDVLRNDAETEGGECATERHHATLTVVVRCKFGVACLDSPRAFEAPVDFSRPV